MLICNLFHPFNNFAWLFFLANGNMGHGAVRRGAMPVFHAHWADDDIAFLDFLHWLAPFLGAPFAGSDYKNLAYRMNMPIGRAPGSKATLPPLERISPFAGYSG